MKAKHESNCEFLDRIMNFGCPTGALIQAFVMQAIEQYARNVIAAPPESMDSPIMSGATWQKTAKFALAEIEKHFER